MRALGQPEKRAVTIDKRPSLAKRAAWLLVLFGLTLASPAQAQQSQLSLADLAIYRAAFEAADLNAWSTARTLVPQASDPLLADVVLWLDLPRRDGGASFAQITQFLDQHPNWPGLTDLRLQAERVMPTNMTPADRVAWHQRYPPLTFDATFAYAEALAALGRQNEIGLYLRSRWPTIPITQGQQDQLLSRFGSTLTTDDHWRRLDNLIWVGRLDEARRMLPLVDSGRRALGNARILLQARQPGVDGAIQAVPANLRNDEGLNYERTRWRRRAGLDAGAIELLPSQPAQSDHARRWWTERHYQAREAFYRGDYSTAYALASDHRQPGGFPLLQGEWLSGWVALRRLNDPARAFGHFQNLYNATSTPISSARGAYWSGRSQAALGNQAEAQRWYQLAAQHPTAFYGQLAAGELGQASVAALEPTPGVPAAAAQAFEADERVQIVRALAQLGQAEHAEAFLAVLISEAETPADHVLVGQLAMEAGNNFRAVRAGKQAVQDGIQVVGSTYPVVDTSTAHSAVDPALVHAIIRTESEFDFDAVSGANARGLMQLLPETARRVGSQIGVSVDTARLTTDPSLNIRLGSSYLADRINRFGGSWVLAIPSYNAGAARVDQWISRFGDPRRMDLYDAIDWMETIPFYETRNYTQRVLETAQVYRRLLGEGPRQQGLEQDIQR